MMKVMSVLLLVMVLLAAAPVVSADPGCPPAFQTHTEGDVHGDGHQHVGLSMGAVDKNTDGAICVKHVGRDGGIHVHIDDFVR